MKLFKSILSSKSNSAILLIIIACISVDVSLKNWTKLQRVIEYDVHHYYAYLPAVFIYEDIKLNKSSYQFEDDYYPFWTAKTDNGSNVVKTSMGLAFLYAPFFFVAHGYALLSDYPANGFSEPYKVFLLVSALFYLCIGLLYIKKILLHYQFSDTTIAITLLLLGLGTNLFCYASQSAPMGHVYSFSLFAIFFYYTIKWHEHTTFKNTIIIGFALGLISLIRPSNLLIVVFFAFYNTNTIKELLQKLRHFNHYLLMLICIILFWLPQLVYWKITTGNLFYYSYPDETFFFNDPKIWDGLFSFRKGWLIYTPIMTFSLAGIFLLRDNFKKIGLALIAFLLLNSYVVFSWWCWWYGGGFGQRALVDSYPLLCIPLASFITYILQKKYYVQIIFSAVALFFIWLNILQTYQFEVGICHWEGMTKELYFKEFGKLHKIDDFDQYVSWPNYEEAKKGNR